jgi:photoactive yellow protein
VTQVLQAQAQHPVVCAWCGIAVGSSTVRGSHGICALCIDDVLGVPALSEADLALLPHGAIELDRTGTILRFNPIEEARLGRGAQHVIGKNFFVDIAPCTAVAAFEGRFRQFLELGGELERFDFTFPFPGRETHVSIAFVGTDHGTAFVLIRTRSSALV